MIYLDNAATTFPKPESVYRAMDEFARTALANPGRAGHHMAVNAKRTLEDARLKLARFINAEKPERLAFTFNATDSLNIAFKGTLNRGDHVITTDLEHNSVSRPLVQLVEDGFITLTRIPTDEGGTISTAMVEKAITPATRMLAITHASNVLGTVQPLDELGAMCRAKKILFCVDAAQTIGVIPIDVQAMKIDMLAFPGHKGLLGPTGTGGLYVASHVSIRPFREGGTGGDSKSPTQPKIFPYLLEGGTPNLLGIVGMAAGLDYVLERGMANIHEHEMALCERFRKGMAKRPEYTLLGHSDPHRRIGTISLRTDLMPSEDLAAILDTSFGICVRAGNHCAPYVHKAVGSYDDGLVRVSPGPFNTESEIDALVSALTEIVGGKNPQE